MSVTVQNVFEWLLLDKTTEYHINWPATSPMQSKNKCLTNLAYQHLKHGNPGFRQLIPGHSLRTIVWLICIDNSVFFLHHRVT